MHYFMYSPLEMSETEAYQLANPYLLDNRIVHITRRSHYYVQIPQGQRPQAAPDTYLVRVEPDGSLRVVHRALS